MHGENLKLKKELSIHQTEDCSTSLLSVLCLHNKHTSRNSPVQQPCVFVTNITFLRCAARHNGAAKN